MKCYARLLAVLILSLSFFSLHALAIQDSLEKETSYVPGEIIVKLKDPSLPLEKQVLKFQGSTIEYSFSEKPAEIRLSGIHVIKLPEGVTVKDAVLKYSLDPTIQYVEPNYLLSCDIQPNDPYFLHQWSMENTGQTGGRKEADIRAMRAWNFSVGTSRIVVAVIDTGVDTNHADIRPNRWLNSNEVPRNGIDDDQNGFIDDYFGWDFRDDDNQPNDQNGHGTFCAGIVGAKGNNSIGITGVNWKVRIMPVKFMGREGTGSVVDATQAILYAKNNGADIISCSWGSSGYSSLLKDAIEEFPGLVVCSAGNNGYDTDIHAHYPSGYPSSNIISVAASDSRDELWPLSNYGASTVDLAAPGDSIISTVPGNSYAYFSGTSAAAPHVSGVAALILAKYPGMNCTVLKKNILKSVTLKEAFSGRVFSGGRLNAEKALQYGMLRPDFSSTLIVGEKPFTVKFSDESAGHITQRMWSFGDGTFSYEEHPLHTYKKSGSYTVQLTIGNPYTTEKIAKELIIRGYSIPKGLKTNKTKKWLIPSRADLS